MLPKSRVSPSTVGRTIKDNPAISEETKNKVRAAMDVRLCPQSCSSDVGNWLNS
ncbi:MAG: LacI family DNA-binding transcriptional regulator [Streptococcus sp.]